MKRVESGLLVLCGLMGAVGVGLLAAGAHADATGRLTTAGGFLLFHAAAVMALATPERMQCRALRLAAGLLVLGAAIFSADIAVRVLIDPAFLPLAAPTGGTLTILGWVVLAIGSAVRLARGR